MNIREGEAVGISLKKLHGEIGDILSYGRIELSTIGGASYYDLYTDAGLACLDGESCEVVRVHENGALFLNRNGETPTVFTLSEEEVNHAVFKRI